MLKKIQNKSQVIFSKLPSSTDIYVFGSSVFTSDFDDIDLLFVIDSDFPDKLALFEMIQEQCQQMGREFGSPIDFTVLTRSEEKELNFANNAQALLITTNSLTMPFVPTH